MRDRLIKLLKQVPYGATVGATFEQHFCEKIADHLIDNDVVPIVRCKDCKHYDGSSCGKITYIMDGYYRGGFELRRPTDFCSYGERRCK